jgi:hypothetical protein
MVLIVILSFTGAIWGLAKIATGIKIDRHGDTRKLHGRDRGTPLGW